MEVRLRILEAINRHDGKWYWYQLDRAMSRYRPGPFTDEVQSLLSAGLIEARERDQHHFYWITEKGKALLRT
jgi:DNA-binding HxlR family transcriptional regulator